MEFVGGAGDVLMSESSQKNWGFIRNGFAGTKNILQTDFYCFGDHRDPKYI
jgi:hypothetical protein